MNHCSFSAHACIGAQQRLFFIKNFLKLPSVSSIIIYCSPGGQKLCLLIYVFFRSLTLKLKLIVCWEGVKNLSQKPLNFLYKNSFLSLSSSPTTHTHTHCSSFQTCLPQYSHYFHFSCSAVYLPPNLLPKITCQQTFVKKTQDFFHEYKFY